MERKYPRTFVPGNERVTWNEKVPWRESSWEEIGRVLLQLSSRKRIGPGVKRLWFIVNPSATNKVNIVVTTCNPDPQISIIRGIQDLDQPLTRSVSSNVVHCRGRRNRLLDVVISTTVAVPCRHEFHPGLLFSSLNDILLSLACRPCAVSS